MEPQHKPNRAYFYEYKGQAEPSFIMIHKDWNVMKLAKKFLSVEIETGLKYLYSYDGSMPTAPDEEDYLPQGHDVFFYKVVYDVHVLRAYCSNVAVKDNKGEAIKISINASESVSDLQKILSPRLEDNSPFRIVAHTKTKGLVALEDSDLMEVASERKIYLELLQLPYSSATNSIIEKFSWPFSTDCIGRNDFCRMITKYHNTNSVSIEAEMFICEMLADLQSTDPAVRSRAEKWNACVNRATNALTDLSRSIPELNTYNDATRRLIINAVNLQTCKFLGQILLVEPYLCHDQTRVPAHFAGKGPLDYLVGEGKRNCLKIYPTDAQATAAEDDIRVYLDERREEYGFDDEEDDEDEDEDEVIVEVETGDPLSRAVLFDIPGTNVGAEYKVLHAAFRQLLAQIYDRTYVDEAIITSVANHAPISSIAAAASTVLGKRKFPSDSRKVEKLTGVLTTGQTWRFYKFTLESAEDMDAENAKLAVEFGGALSMPRAVVRRRGEGLQNEGRKGYGRTGCAGEVRICVVPCDDVCAR